MVQHSQNTWGGLSTPQKLWQPLSPQRTFLKEEERGKEREGGREEKRRRGRKRRRDSFRTQERIRDQTRFLQAPAGLRPNQAHLGDF